MLFAWRGHVAARRAVPTWANPRIAYHSTAVLGATSETMVAGLRAKILEHPALAAARRTVLYTRNFVGKSSHPFMISARNTVDYANVKTKAHPIRAAALIAGVKTFLADLFVQTAYEKQDVDWNRAAAFTIFGVAYLGVWHSCLYGFIFPRVFPGLGMMSAAKCVAVDQGIHSLFIYLPIFYMIQDAVVNMRVNVDTARDALARYSRNLSSDAVNCWKVWIPAQIVNFTLVPLHWRAPFVAFVSFFWTCILSALRGNAVKE